MAVYYIDPTAQTNGNGTEQSPFSSWANISVQSGNTYLQKSGTSYGGTLVLTADNVTISSYGSGAAPQVGGVYFYGGGNDSVSNFTIQGNALAGVVFSNGAANDSLTNSSLSGNGMGAMFSAGTGAGNSVSGDDIYDNNNFGVGIAQGSTATVTDNTIHDNARHGVEVAGDNCTVTYNYVYGNGTVDQGASGIHAYAGSSSVDSGNFNNISWNVVEGTHDQNDGDGNGIETDQWTHGNSIDGNIVYNCDGAGINSYDASNNNFVGNMVFSNEQGNYADHGVHSQICFVESTQNNGQDYENYLQYNIFDATVPNTTDLFVEDGLTEGQQVAANSMAGLTGDMTASQLASEVSSHYTWWIGHNIPASLQATGHAALEQMASF